MHVQTGECGTPHEPFTISFSLVGSDHERPPDFRSSMSTARACFEQIRGRHLAQGHLLWKDIHLHRVTPDGRQRVFHFKTGKVDDKRWAESVSGMGDDYDAMVLNVPQWGQIRLESSATATTGKPDQCRLSGHVRSPAAMVRQDATDLLDLLSTLACVPGVRTGFVHVDSVADPYSSIVVRQSRLSTNQYDSEVHGYYWAVLLGPGHLSRLMAAQGDLPKPPTAIDRAIDDADPPLRLCVLTADPLDATEETYRVWRSFLQPILRVGYAGALEGCPRFGKTYSTALLARPVWLFEGDPVPAVTFNVLKSGVHPRGDSVRIEWAEEPGDPDRPTCWLYPGEGFVVGTHFGLVRSIVRAWTMTGQAGQLLGGGRLHEVSDVSWDTDDEFHDVMAWQFDPGECDITIAIDRLSDAFGALAVALAVESCDDLLVRLVVR